MKITYTMLKRKGACKSQLNKFRELFPKGVVVTETLCLAYAQEDFNLDWAAQHLLSPRVRAEYHRARDLAGAEYDQARKLANDEANNRVRELVGAKYDRARDLVWAKYRWECKRELVKYRRVCASAFGKVVEENRIDERNYRCYRQGSLPLFRQEASQGRAGL